MWFLILVGIVVLFFITLEIRMQISFYTKATCSICGAATGRKGSKRYKLADGFMCQSCAEKYIMRASLSGVGPNAYMSETVETARERINRRSEMGEEAWRQWIEEQYPTPIIGRSDPKPRYSDSAVHCPKCGSTQISANQKGFGVGKAVIGAAVAGPIGLTAGNIGSKKVIVTCLKCGYQWQAGKK